MQDWALPTVAHPLAGSLAWSLTPPLPGLCSEVGQQRMWGSEIAGHWGNLGVQCCFISRHFIPAVPCAPRGCCSSTTLPSSTLEYPVQRVPTAVPFGCRLPAASMNKCRFPVSGTWNWRCTWVRCHGINPTNSWFPPVRALMRLSVASRSGGTNKALVATRIAEHLRSNPVPNCKVTPSVN